VTFRDTSRETSLKRDMADDFDKRWRKFLKQGADFRSGKRQQYPEMLLEPLYVDKGWEPPEPEPDSGNVRGFVSDAERERQHERLSLRQQYIDNWMQSQMRLFQITHGMDPDVSASWGVWAVARRLPGFQTTSVPPKSNRRRGAPVKYGPMFSLELTHMVAIVRAAIAKGDNTTPDQVSVITALQGLNERFFERWGLLDKWKADRKTLLRSLSIRHSEALGSARRGAATARRLGFSPLAELGERYKNSRPDHVDL